jgi:SSS family solute:Na+ symporter
MFGGFIAASLLCLHKYGGLHYLAAPGRLPVGHLNLLGGGDIWVAAAWFFIAMNTLIDPGFHQRCYAAKSPKVAFFGILIAVLCWMLFDACSIVTGLYSKALIPGLSNALLAYPALADRVMPIGLKGLFTVGLLAPVMASAVSYTFISAMTVGRDFLWRLKGDKDTQNLPKYAQIGLIFTSMSAIGFAILIPSMVKQWYIFGSVTVPGVLIPLLGAYQPSQRWRATGDWAFSSMIGGVGASLVWLLWGVAHGGLFDPSYPFGWQPLFPGLAVSALLYGIGIWVNRRSVTEADDIQEDAATKEKVGELV